MQNSFSFSDFDVTSDQIRTEFKSIIGDAPFFADLGIILEIGIKNRSLFPNIRLSEGATWKEYLVKWVKGYEDAMRNLPSSRRAAPKGSCSDPAIQTMVQIATDMDAAFIKRMSEYHNLFMSAENVQGNLLEEYISNSVRLYGWIWCNGNVFRAVDFCSLDGAVLLQIKNKSNTENSSSSAIRIGTAIKKWYRLGTQVRNGKKIPIYKWDELNKIINSYITTGVEPACNMNEEDYQMFLCKVTQQIKNIISNQ